MRVLIVHNRYQQAGGEDAVARAEAALLRTHGVAVELLERSNLELKGVRVALAAAGTLWSWPSAELVRNRVRATRAEVVHVHNTFPLLSPSVYWAARAAGAVVVQTLHNYRLFCVGATLERDERICEDCLGRSPWRGAMHACYRSSRPASLVAAASLALHRVIGSYRNQVDRYIALNRFCRDKFVVAGLPLERLAIKPNFVDLPRPPGLRPRRGLLYAGRLSREKGLLVLAEAARAPGWTRPLDLIGTGPLAAQLAEAPGLRRLGPLPARAVYAHMRRALALVLPSVWYEAFPRVLVEAYACGLPVIASRLGALAELVEEGVTGLLFEPGNAAALRTRIDWALAHPEAMARMGWAARACYERCYTPADNFAQLTGIYRQALAERA